MNGVSTLKTNHNSRTDSASNFTLQKWPASERVAVMELWRELEQELLVDGSHVPLAVTSTWTDTWLDHYGDLIPHQFLLVKQDQQLRGICLVCSGVDQFDGPFRLKTLHLGTAGESENDSVVVEYNSILTADHLRPIMLCKIVEHLHADNSWQELHLDGFSQTCCEELQAIWTENRWEGNLHQRVVPSYYHDLQQVRETSDELLHEFGKSTRKNLKRNLNAAEKLREDWAETESQAVEIFENLVQLHQERWTSIGQPGAYASPRFLNFHRDLLTRLWNERRVAMFRVHEGNQVLGCVQLWIDHNRVFEYQSGNLGNAGKLSPGLLVDFLCMQAAMARGFDAFDFLGGDTRHKRSLSHAHNTLTWLRFARPNWKSRVANLGRVVKQQLNQCRSKLTSKRAEGK